MSNNPRCPRSSGVSSRQAQPQPGAAVNASDPGTQTADSENPFSPEEYVKEMRGWLMVVATLIASLMFQAGLNPPGGFWQDDLNYSAIYPPTVDLARNISTIVGTLMDISTHPSSLSSILDSPPSDLSRFIFKLTPLGVPNNVTGHTVLAGINRIRHYLSLISMSLTFACSLLVIIVLLNERIFRSITLLLELRTIVFCNLVLVWISFALVTPIPHVGNELIVYSLYVSIPPVVYFIVKAILACCSGSQPYRRL